MILAIDIGNSNIVIGGIDSTGIHFISRILTERNKTADQIAIDFFHLLDLYQVDRKKLEGAIISSVVPPLIKAVRDAVQKIIGKTALVVGPGIKSGINIKVDNPAQVGSDIVVNNVAALNKYPAPVVVIDMGTATTVSVSDERRTLLGCAIAPGVSISLDALSSRAAQIPQIDLDAPAKAIGTNTVDSMKSGIVFGTAAMLDGLIRRFEQEVGEIKTVVATGGHAAYIVPHCERQVEYNPNLLLEGLYVIYKINCATRTLNCI